MTPNAFKWVIGLINRQAVMATAQNIATLIDLFKVKEADITDIDTMWETDEDEINNQLGATSHAVFERKGTVARKCKLTLELLTWALAMMFGKVTASGTTPNFISTIRWRDICTINPNLFTYLEALDCAGLTGTWFSYKGAIIESIVVEFTGKGPGSLTLNIKHDGSETAQVSAVLPASPYAANILYGNQLTVFFGPLGTEDITDILRSWKMTITMGSVEPPSLKGVTVQEWQYGLKGPKIDIEMTAHFDKSHAIYGYYSQSGAPTNVTTVKHIAQMVVNANRQIVLTNSQGKAEVKIKPSGQEFIGTIKFLEEFQATDAGAGVFVCKHGIGANLLVAG